jgi:hydrogenase/urease accessory protein HupE
MAGRFVVGFVLLFGLLIGLTCEPDSGTAASVGPPDVSGMALGANHAKPLPRVPSVEDLLRTSVTALLVLVVLTRISQINTFDVARDDHRHRSVFRSLVRTRRGPPAPIFG